MARKNIEKQNVLEQVETVSVKTILDSIYNSKDYDNIYEHLCVIKHITQALFQIKISIAYLKSAIWTGSF